MGEVSALKSIRIWFKKVGTAKYISHLDLCRCMERAIHKAKLPFWYSQGFNPHVFLTITMPISLGYTGLRESMDVKLTDEGLGKEEIMEKLNLSLPAGIQIFDVTEPKMKPSDVVYSTYEITLENLPGLEEAVKALRSQEQILVEKHTKKGMRQVDIKSDFAEMRVDDTGESLKFLVTLLSSNAGSINPRLFFDALSTKFGRELYPETVRTGCLNGNFEEFA